MLQKPMDVLAAFPVRKSKKQKESFRAEALDYFSNLGYQTSVEKGTLGARNVIAGDPEKAKYLITAHYDTCARLPIPNLITPCSLLLFLGYQILLTILILIPPLIGSSLASYLSPYLTLFVFEMLLLIMIVLIMAGPANPSNVNDNTSGVIAVMDMAKAMPEHLREHVCFVLFDLEEAGLIGSSSYQSKHRKQTCNQLVFNFDCIGEGDDILLIPTGKLKKDAALISALKQCSRNRGDKQIHLLDRGFAIYPSDQTQFPFGIGICAMKTSRFGWYLAKIHTPKDTVLDYENVNILRDSLIDWIGNHAVK